jgi:Uma2 family endonuclease
MAVYAQQEKHVYSPEEYLSLERTADFKSEYLNGQIYAMAGSSPEHSAITVNITVALGSQLLDKPCRAFSSDMKVRTTRTGLFAYPDLSIVCGEPEFHDEKRDVLVNPVVLIEVLSPSTEAFDRGKKFAQYQHLETLTDYLLIAQDEARIDHYVKQSDDLWLLSIARGSGGKIYIASLDCTLLLSQVYAKISLSATE